MTVKAHRATRPASSSRAGTAVLDRPQAAPQHEHLLQLQREAGNEAVTNLLLQRKAAPKKPKQPKNEWNDVAAFINGFQDLAVAVSAGGARAAYGPKFDKDLSADRLATLERVRRVFIKAQGDKSARKAAQAEWPRLVAQLTAGADAGKRLGMSARNLTLFLDNVDVMGDRYVGAKDNRADAKAGTSSADEFAAGIQALTGVIDRTWYDLTSGVVPKNITEVNLQQQAALRAVKFGDGLSKRHRALLDQYRQALLAARDRGSAKLAYAIWKDIRNDIAVTLDPKIHAHLKDLVADIGKKLIEGGLYNEKHNAALDKTALKDPKEFIDLNSLKVVAQDLIVAKDVADKAIALGAGASMGAFFKAAGLSDDLGGAFWDLAKNPGEVGAKVAEWKKMGVVAQSVTVADLADKMLALRQAVYTVSLNAIKEVAERQGKAALAKGVADAVSKWKGVGEWATKHLDAVQKVGKVAGRIGVGVSVIKMADAIIRGDYGAAFQEAVTTGLQWGAGAAGGVAGGAMFAGIGVIIAAQIEGISGAAAMIRYAKEQNVKDAALGFIGVCETAASVEVKAMLADMKLVGDPDLADQQDEIQQRLVSHHAYWVRHLAQLRKLYTSDRVNTIGGQPALKGALGVQAGVAVMSDPPATWEGLGTQIRWVFAGANSMSQYVAKQYAAKG